VMWRKRSAVPLPAYNTPLGLYRLISSQNLTNDLCSPFGEGNNVGVLPIVADGQHGRDCYTHAPTNNGDFKMNPPA
jgi:hypothetical protein